MSYTNQTQHYGLPQYVGTDVPAWLTDINGAFATIDQGMNAAKTQADSAATAAGQAANDIVSINSTLGTQAGQISAAANAAAAAQTTANTADGKADENTQNISGLDARVTALEEGGSGGLEYKDYTVASGDAFLAINEPGKAPYAAQYLSGTFVGALYIRDMSDGAYQIRGFSISGSTISAANLVPGQIRVLFVDKV